MDFDCSLFLISLKNFFHVLSAFYLNELYSILLLRSLLNYSLNGLVQLPFLINFMSRFALDISISFKKKKESSSSEEESSDDEEDLEELRFVYQE